MDKGKTISLPGTTGNIYIFTTYPWNTSLISYGAVYSVLRRNKHGHEIIYIGSTGELKHHLSSHPLLPEFEKANATHIGVHIEPVISKRYAKQQDLILKFTPALNKG